MVVAGGWLLSAESFLDALFSLDRLSRNVTNYPPTYESAEQLPIRPLLGQLTLVLPHAGNRAAFRFYQSLVKENDGRHRKALPSLRSLTVLDPNGVAARDAEGNPASTTFPEPSPPNIWTEERLERLLNRVRMTVVNRMHGGPLPLA